MNLFQDMFISTGRLIYMRIKNKINFSTPVKRAMLLHGTFNQKHHAI